MNLLDLLILLAVAVAFFFALRAYRRGKGRCGGSCGGCPYAGSCHSVQKKERADD